MRLVQETRKENPELSVNQVVIRIGQRVGVNADMLRGWVKQAQIDAGERPGTTTDGASKIKQLEAEVQGSTIKTSGHRDRGDVRSSSKDHTVATLSPERRTSHRALHHSMRHYSVG